MGSMNLTDMKDLYRNTADFIDKEVTVGGWVRSIRDSKTFGFIVLNDGTFFEPLQVVYDDSLENFEKISKLNVQYIVDLHQCVQGFIVAPEAAVRRFKLVLADLDYHVPVLFMIKSAALLGQQGIEQNALLFAQLFIEQLVHTVSFLI